LLWVKEVAALLVAVITAARLPAAAISAPPIRALRREGTALLVLGLLIGFAHSPQPKCPMSSLPARVAGTRFYVN